MCNSSINIFPTVYNIVCQSLVYRYNSPLLKSLVINATKVSLQTLLYKLLGANFNKVNQLQGKKTKVVYRNIIV